MLQIISHEVKDVDVWLSFNDERVKTFSKFADNIIDFVDTEKSTEVYQKWLKKTRPAPGPNGLRRPLWLKRPLKPDEDQFYFKEE